MSDTPTTTPRTDANTYSAETLAISAERIKVVHADFSKQLETELTAAQKERDNLKHELEISRSESDEYREQRDKLTEALRNLVNANETWNQGMRDIIGRPPNWNESYLNESRVALQSLNQNEKSAGTDASGKTL